MPRLVSPAECTHCVVSPTPPSSPPKPPPYSYSYWRRPARTPTTTPQTPAEGNIDKPDVDKPEPAVSAAASMSTSVSMPNLGGRSKAAPIPTRASKPVKAVKPVQPPTKPFSPYLDDESLASDYSDEDDDIRDHRAPRRRRLPSHTSQRDTLVVMRSRSFSDSYSSPPSDSEPQPPPTGLKHTLTLLVRSFVHRYVVPLLPADLAEVVANPPDFSDPASLVPLLRAVAPYTQFLLLLVGLYVVWAVVTGFIGYLARFVRFCLRIGPVIAIIAWIMAASGQGGIDVLFEALKQYALGTPEAEGVRRRAPGAAGTEFYPPPGERRRRNSRTGGGEYWDARSATGSRSKTYNTRSSTKKNTNANPPRQQAPDLLASLLGNGLGNGENAGVQDYVRQAVLRAAGLDWLFGASEPEKDERKKRGTR